MKTIRLLCVAFLFVLAIPGYAEDEASKNSIREVQQVLSQCGFNPGPIDGAWGKRTTEAATAFVRAHGGNPSNDKVMLMAQVDGERGTDAGPCPPAETTTQVSNESRPADEAGSVEADQGQEVETGGSNVDIESVSKKIQQFKRIAGGLIYDAGNNYHLEIVVLKDRIVEQIYRDGVKIEINSTIMFSELERAYIKGSRNTGYNLYVDLIENATKYSRGGLSGFYFSGGLSGFYFNDYDHTESAAIALDEVAEIYRENRINPSQPAKCYKWVSLGTFHLGTWVNGNGRKTSGLNAGSDTRLWDDEELAEEYQVSREQCVSSANGALDNAISAMVIIGRKAVEVDNEKKRIKDFYQNNLDKCQAGFKRRFKKYENKFCD